MRAATNRLTSNQRHHAAGTGSDRGLARAPPRSDLVEGVRSSLHAAGRAEVRGLKASAHTHAFFLGAWACIRCRVVDTLLDSVRLGAKRMKTHKNSRKHTQGIICKRKGKAL